jgi:DNA polymerase III epsilon subunit-like protein
MYDSFISFDTETTGLNEDARIIELAAIWWVDGQIKDVFDSRFDPSPIDWEDEQVKQAQAINQIAKEELIGCPTFESHVDLLEGFLQLAPVLVAHNAEFDLRMVRQEMDRVGYCFQPERIVCTMRLDQRISPRPHRLASSCARWGVDLKNAHSAFGDAKACGELLLKIQNSGRLPANMQ